MRDAPEPLVPLHHHDDKLLLARLFHPDLADVPLVVQHQDRLHPEVNALDRNRLEFILELLMVDGRDRHRHVVASKRDGGVNAHGANH